MGDETGAEGGGFGAAYEDDETADGRRANVLLSYTALLGLGDGKGRIVCRLGEQGCFLWVDFREIINGVGFFRSFAKKLQTRPITTRRIIASYKQ